MQSDGQPASSGASEESEYCRFAKRNLDGWSWLYPLVNNPVGDLLNVELRHEQLFFIQGERILDNIGYTEQGRRFREEEFGRELKTLADLPRYGYWLVGRRYDADCAREALARMDDGAFYSVLSNQCQDWTDRLRREIESLERERHIEVPAGEGASRLSPWERLRLTRGTTAPAAWYLGSITLMAGGFGVLAPLLVARLYLRFLGLLLLAIGISDIHFAWRGGWRSSGPTTVLLGIVKAVFGSVLLLADVAALAWAWVLPGVALLVLGLLQLPQALFSRPHAAWWETGAAGVLRVAAGLFLISVGRGGDARLIGLIFALSLLATGVSTVLLDWHLRKVEPP